MASSADQRSDSVERYQREAFHSIRNYMAVATGAIHFARKAPDQASLRRYLDSADGAIKRAGAIADTLTKLSATPATAAFGVSEAITELEPLCQALARHNIVVELELRCPGTRVCVDRNAFEAALLELVANARDAIEGNGRIRIRAAAIGRRVAVIIGDNGIGMPDAVRNGEHRHSTKPNGTGTGLAQVRAFAANAGGRLHIRSLPDKGSVVAFDLPMVS
jgi:signal transduction histidine kinase